MTWEDDEREEVLEHGTAVSYALCAGHLESAWSLVTRIERHFSASGHGI